jgi:GntR family transcriptional regulator
MPKLPLDHSLPANGKRPRSGTNRLDSSSFVPLYHQLKEILKASIAASVWKANEMIPSENELAATYNVAVGTVKKALAELTREGFIMRRQGRGTFVARPDFGRSFFRFFRFDVNPRGEQNVIPISKVLSTRSIRPPSRPREVLRLSGRERVLHIQRLRAFNDLPLMYEDLYLPEKIFAGLEKIDITRELLYPIYDSRFNTPVIWADEFLEPHLATSDVAGHLQIKAGDPVIFLERIAYTFEDRPIEFRTSYGRGDRFRYHIELH